MRFPNLKGRFYSNTMFAKTKSTRLHAAAQLFTNGQGYVRFYPIESKKYCHTTLTSFIEDVGIPQTIVTDNAPELMQGEWKVVCQKHHIEQRETVPYSPWSNLAEAAVRETKKSITRNFDVHTPHSTVHSE